MSNLIYYGKSEDYEEQVKKARLCDKKDEEIERLKDLCDKYEEEHKTTFEEWKKAINIIKEVREYIEKTKFKYCDDELCYMIENHYNNILEILDKGSSKE